MNKLTPSAGSRRRHRDTPPFPLLVDVFSSLFAITFSRRRKSVPTKTTKPDRRACCALSFFEPYRFLRATSVVPSAVRVRTHPSQLAAVNDQVLIAYGTTAEPALQDFAYPCGVARLCR